MYLKNRRNNLIEKGNTIDRNIVILKVIVKLFGVEMLMEIKLIALDLDGTLLTSDLKITKNTIDVLNEAMNKGKEVVICTGRTIAELPLEFEHMPYIKYYITSNGAIIWDRHHIRMIYENPIPVDDVRKLMDILKPFDLRIELFALGRVFIDQYCYDHLDEYGGGNHVEFLHGSRTPVPEIKSFIQEFDEPVDKFNLFFKTPEQRKEVWDKCVALGFNVTSSFEQNMEVNSKTANKGTALKSLVNRLNIDVSSVMVVGDQLNDMTMLRYAGHPIAMGNAVDDIKSLATYITKTNDEDGVAHAVKKLVLEGEDNENLFF